LPGNPSNARDAHVWRLVDTRLATQLIARAARQQLDAETFYSLVIQFAPLGIDFPDLHRAPALQNPVNAPLIDTTPPPYVPFAPKLPSLLDNLLVILAVGFATVLPSSVVAVALILFTLKALFSNH
jgi:hypothetical protein